MSARKRTATTAGLSLALIALFLGLLTILPGPAQAESPPPTLAELIADPSLMPAAPAACEPDGTQASGAIYRICLPSGWDGNTLVIYAHGYVDPAKPVDIPEDQLGVPGLSIPDTVNSLGYAFAVSGYSVNGLAVQEGKADLLDLVQIFTAQHGAPQRVLMLGISEGGLITALSMEQHPEVYDGGLAICGPLGGLPVQTAYFGDFRAVFDYFFPGVMPGSPISIPTTLMADWDNVYTSTVRPAILDPTNADKVRRLLAVTGAATDPANPDTIEQTIQTLLWYNVSATNDAFAKLGGNPYSNTAKAYTGSDDDPALNAGVARYTADAGAADLLAQNYVPTGVLTVPLITAHTTGDHVVPYFHQTLYADKAQASGSGWLHTAITSPTYGHCTLTILDLLSAFAELESRSLHPYRVQLPWVAK